METEENSPVRNFWHEIVGDTANQMAEFFSACRDTISIVSNKAHIVLLLYLAFLSAIFAGIVFYVIVTFSLALSLGVNIFRYLVGS